MTRQTIHSRGEWWRAVGLIVLSIFFAFGAVLIDYVMLIMFFRSVPLESRGARRNAVDFGWSRGDWTWLVLLVLVTTVMAMAMHGVRIGFRRLREQKEIRGFPMD